MVPDQQRAGRDLVDLDPHGTVPVTLYWQQWRLRSAALDAVAGAVRAAAAAAFRPV
jgi:LysR family transcriptional regulator, chromosome initiation inhibitor